MSPNLEADEIPLKEVDGISLQFDYVFIAFSIHSCNLAMKRLNEGLIELDKLLISAQ
jgi:hypothetical protein